MTEAEKNTMILDSIKEFNNLVKNIETELHNYLESNAESIDEKFADSLECDSLLSLGFCTCPKFIITTDDLYSYIKGGDHIYLQTAICNENYYDLVVLYIDSKVIKTLKKNPEEVKHLDFCVNELSYSADRGITLSIVVNDFIPDNQIFMNEL